MRTHLVLQERLSDRRERWHRQQGLEGLEHSVGETLKRRPRRFAATAGWRPGAGRDGSQKQQEFLIVISAHQGGGEVKLGEARFGECQTV